MPTDGAFLRRFTTNANALPCGSVNPTGLHFFHPEAQCRPDFPGGDQERFH
jgi:hypothetical protein